MKRSCTTQDNRSKRVAHTDKSSRIPLKRRQAAVEKLHQILFNKEKALEEEIKIYSKSVGLDSYRNLFSQTIVQLRRSQTGDSVADSVADSVVIVDPIVSIREKFQNHCKGFDAINNYLLSVEKDMSLLQELMPCERCSICFIPCDDANTCTYHPLRLKRKQNEKTFPCCGGSNTSPGCEICHSHVYSIKDPCIAAKLLPFLSTGDGCGVPVVAMDCEMCYTSLGMEVVRISLVDHQLVCVLDILVQPRGTLIDYNQRFSGINQQVMEKFTPIVPSNVESHSSFTFDQSMNIMNKLISQATILIGHSLDSDLTALRLVHENIVDTSLLYPHGLGGSYRHSLKYLALEHLKEFVQEDEKGHDSIEDARIAMRLALKFIE